MTSSSQSALPLVSVVTPTLNRASYLPGLLESLRVQTYPRIEHVVVDGGSTDGTIELLEAARDEHGVHWISEPDTGMYNAVNKGLRLATGDIVAYLNSDDRYFPYSVEVAVSALDDPAVGFVYGDMLNYDESFGEGSIFFYPPFSKAYLRSGGFIGQPTVFWRASATEEVGGFDEGLQLASDHDYWRRLATRSAGRKLHEVLAFEEQHPGRLTSGEEGRVKGTAELTSVRRRHFGDHAPGLVERLLAALHRGFWRRALTLGFLWSRRRGTSAPGRAWGGFNRDDAFEVRVGIALLGLLPVFGRSYGRSIVRR